MNPMGIVKVEINLSELKEAVEGLVKKREQVFELLTVELKQAASHALTQLMNSEMTLFLGKSDQNDNKRNGYSVKEYAIKGLGALSVRVPTDRKREFESAIVPKHERIEKRLKEDLAVLHLAGISTRNLGMISRRILGLEVSPQTVSNSLETIEEKAISWLNRPMTQRYWALYVDGTNFRVQRRGSTEKEPSLVVLGLDENNCKSILAIEPGSKENADAWRSVFRSLTNRGLDVKAVKVGIMDGLPGLENVFREVFYHAVTARCFVHSKRNILNKTPKRLQEAMDVMFNKIMYATSENAAKDAFISLKTAMNQDAERAVKCLERDLPSLLTHYQFDQKYWIALKTTNPIERVNKEFKRRSKAMESMGERTLESLLAFTALRLEMGWKKSPIDSNKLANLRNVKDKINTLDEAFNTLIQ